MDTMATAVSTHHRVRPGTVLVIDDDEATRGTFAHALRLEGFRVRTAENAEVGLLEAEEAHPDVIIVDLRMPFVNGLGFLYRLRMRDEHRDTPVAIVTGDYTIEQQMADELRQLGAQIHYKPLWLEDLIALTGRLLTAPRRPLVEASPPSH
jgi:DNA-binding response OmpR family regulator